MNVMFFNAVVFYVYYVINEFFMVYILKLRCNPEYIELKICEIMCAKKINSKYGTSSSHCNSNKKS